MGLAAITVPEAIIGAGAIGAGATAISSSNAAHAQTTAANNAITAQQGFYNQDQTQLQPFITGGQGAYSTLNNLLGIGGNGISSSGGTSADIQNTLNNLPGYQFTLNQGLKATQGGYAAQGLADSGAALKGAATYATGLAQSNYNNYLTGLQNSATTGENAANALAGYGTQTGAQIGSNIIGAGNAQAAASTATGNALTNGTNNLSQYYTLNSLLNNTNQALNPVNVTPAQTITD